MGCSGDGRSLSTSEQQARLLFSYDLVTGPVLEMDSAQAEGRRYRALGPRLFVYAALVGGDRRLDGVVDHPISRCFRRHVNLNNGE